MNKDEFIRNVEKLIDEYGAPESITEELKNFLVQNGNAFCIGELWEGVQ